MKNILETERLILREFHITDAESVYEFGANKEVTKYTGDDLLESIDEAKRIITDVWYNDYSKYGYGRWAVVYKPDNKVIGFAGLKYLPEMEETDIGYRILPEYWRKGITTEASKEIIKYGFENLNLDCIIGIALKDNVGSWKILEKLGFTFYEEKAYIDSKEKYNWYRLNKANYLSN